MILLLIFLPDGHRSAASSQTRAGLRALLRPSRGAGRSRLVAAVADGAAGRRESAAPCAERAPPVDAGVIAAAERADRRPRSAGEVLLRVEDVSVHFGGLKAVNESPWRCARARSPRSSARTAPARRRSSTPSAACRPDDRARSLRRHRTSPSCRRPTTARLGMARTFQNLRIFVNMSVLENVLVGCHQHEQLRLLGRRPRPPAPAREEKRSRERAMRGTRLVGLEGRAHLPAASLPYGIAAPGGDRPRAGVRAAGCSCWTSRRPA